MRFYSSLVHEQHPKGGIDFDSIDDEKTSSLDELVYVNILHPGYVATELNRSSQATFGKTAGLFVEYVTKIVGMAPENGALTQLYCATNSEVENPIAFDDDLQERLWSWTENIVREKLKV
ncbi:hypothetical protein BGZ82_000831 [Podila clonocystis]|nr:hypothetical protein BGZ82_000831 [Podila clonocystis]